MKKLFVFAAIALATVVACSKGGDKTPAAEAPIAPQEDNACVVVIPKDAPVKLEIPIQQSSGEELDNKKVIVEEIEFMRGGVFVGFGVLAPNASAVPSIRPRTTDGEKYYFSGTYTVDSNGAFILDGDIKCEITVNQEDDTISVKEEGQETPTEIPAEVTDTPAPQENDVEKMLCLAWKVESIEAEVVLKPQGDKPLSIKHKFAGNEANNIGAIAKYINDQSKEYNLGFTLNQEYFDQYVIKYIGISGDPKYTVSVNFVKAGLEPLVAKWAWSSKEQKQFSYHVETSVSGEFFTADAVGSVDFAENGNQLIVSVSITAKDVSGTLKIKGRIYE